MGKGSDEIEFEVDPLDPDRKSIGWAAGKAIDLEVKRTARRNVAWEVLRYPLFESFASQPPLQQIVTVWLQQIDGLMAFHQKNIAPADEPTALQLKVQSESMVLKNGSGEAIGEPIYAATVPTSIDFVTELARRFYDEYSDGVLKAVTLGGKRGWVIDFPGIAGTNKKGEETTLQWSFGRFHSSLSGETNPAAAVIALAQWAEGKWGGDHKGYFKQIKQRLREEEARLWGELTKLLLN